MKRIAIFASGTGSNAEAIMTFFEQNPSRGCVAGVISNNNDALVIEKAKKHNVNCIVISKNDFYKNPQIVLNTLNEWKTDWIILAGFMLLVHEKIVAKFDRHIINIHPALLPKFGGKGMYGNFVHKAVVEAKEKQSGITIHLVNNKYDDGDIIFQASTPVKETDSAEDVAKKVQELELKYFPKIISETINK